MTIKDSDLYRMFWKSKNSNIVEWSEPSDYYTAKSWADAMNKKYPKIEHWAAISESVDVYEKSNARWRSEESE